LLQQLPSPWNADASLVDAGKELDKHYILPRYPNSYPQGAPYEYYTRDEAERAIAYTTRILGFCERLLVESGIGTDASEAGGATPGQTPPGN
jgi:HEPN domain-containing protein